MSRIASDKKGLAKLASKKMVQTSEDVLLSSGNVFADLGLAESDQLQVKSGMLIMIRRIISERGLTQVAAAQELQIDQPKVSRIMKGDLYGFSSDQLMRFLTLLGEDIEIVVHGRGAGRAKGGAKDRDDHRGKVTIRAA